MITERQLATLRSALGMQARGYLPSQRHIAVSPWSPEYEDCVALVAAGMMSKFQSSDSSSASELFLVTPAGREAAKWDM